MQTESTGVNSELDVSVIVDMMKEISIPESTLLKARKVPKAVETLEKYFTNGENVSTY